MEYRDNAKLDSSQVSGSGGGGGGRVGGIAVGGGIGTMLLLLVLSQVLGVDLTGLAGSEGSQTQETSGSQQNDPYQNCQTGGDVRTDRNCRFVAYTNSIQAYWGSQIKNYRPVTTRIFSGRISTACGTATSAVGPFYCPGDQTVYLDTGFFDQLTGQLGARGGDAAEAYVIAHEYGHHISNLTGQMSKAQQDRSTGPESGSVRLELQADCYAGVWLKNAGADPQGPISGVNADDLARAVDAAQAVGDDRIQEESQGRVDRESWTHGSSEMRKTWLMTGFTSGQPQSCDTFAAGAKVG